MAMQIQRTLPPAASPVGLASLIRKMAHLHEPDREFGRFQAELKQFLRVSNCFLVSSGKAALVVILRAMKSLAPNRDVVILPAYTCYSVPSSVIRAGLKVSLCDVNPKTLDLDYDHLIRLIADSNGDTEGGKVLCVISTHLFGYTADVRRVKNLLDGSGAWVLEDAAQALGERAGKMKAGGGGDIGLLSLARGKPYTTMEGGVIVTNDATLAAAVKRELDKIPPFGSHEVLKMIFSALGMEIFINPMLYWFPASLSFLELGLTKFDPTFKIRQMSHFQARLSRDWPETLKKFQNRRRRNTKRLWKIFSGNFSDCLEKIPFRDEHPIRFPVLISNTQKKKTILRLGREKGLGVATSYPGPISDIAFFKEQFRGKSFPGAERLARELVTFPVHPLVKIKDLEKIEKYILPVFFTKAAQ